MDEKTRTAKVRMEFHNPGYFLKPGMFATVQVTSELEPSALLIPDMAILRSGENTTVFVALEGGKFEPRRVILGPQAEGDAYQVVSGLKEGERLVTSGQFMLDSESQLREAIQKMKEPKPAAETTPGIPEATNASDSVSRNGHADETPASRVRRPQIHLPDARTRLDRIRSSWQVRYLRHDARPGLGGNAEEARTRRQGALLHLPHA